MHLNTMGHAWLRRLSVIAALSTLALVIAGGMGYQSAHRTLAAPVGILIIALASGLQIKEPRAWMRRLGWSAAASVLGQAALGMALVRFFSPPLAAVGHALLAQICFALTAAIAAGQVFSVSGFEGWTQRGPVPAIAATALLAQAGLGAAVRHQATGVTPHVAGAAIATVLVMWACLQVLTRQLETPRLRRPALLLLSLTFSQVFLGIGSSIDSMVAGGVAVWEWFRPAHLVAGTMGLGTAVVLTLLTYGQAQRGEHALHEGVAVA